MRIEIPSLAAALELQERQESTDNLSKFTIAVELLACAVEGLQTMIEDFGKIAEKANGILQHKTKAN